MMLEKENQDLKVNIVKLEEEKDVLYNEVERVISERDSNINNFTNMKLENRKLMKLIVDNNFERIEQWKKEKDEI